MTLSFLTRCARLGSIPTGEGVRLAFAHNAAEQQLGLWIVFGLSCDDAFARAAIRVGRAEDLFASGISDFFFTEFGAFGESLAGCNVQRR